MCVPVFVVFCCSLVGGNINIPLQSLLEPVLWEHNAFIVAMTYCENNNNNSNNNPAKPLASVRFLAAILQHLADASATLLWPGLFTGHDPPADRVRKVLKSPGLGWVGTGRVGSDRIGSGQEGFEISRVGSGRVGSVHVGSGETQTRTTTG